MSKFWKNLARFAALAVLWISFLITLWILLICLNDGLGIEGSKYLAGLFVITLALGGGVTFLRRRRPKFFGHPKFYLVLTIVAVVMGVILRLVFLRFYQNYAPVDNGSDTGIHWYAAQEILETGRIRDEFMGNYEAFFTQLTSYTLLVAVSMWFVGVNYLAILLPNILFDLIAAGAIYLLLKKWKGEKVAAWGVVLAMINPLCICFCVEGLALSVVNMFIALGFWLIYVLWKFLQRGEYGKFWLSAGVTGLVLACGNAFRPVFSVLVIAVFGMLVLDSLQRVDWKHTLKSGGGFVIMLVVFVVGGLGWDGIYRLANPYYQTERHSMLGWNFFVGANFETEGRWSQEDSRLIGPSFYSDEDGKVTPPEEVNAEFMKMGLERYRGMDLGRIGLHFLNKSRILFGENEVRVAENLREQFDNVDGNETWYKITNTVAMITLTVFAILTVIYFWTIIKVTKREKIDLFGVLVSLIFCGFFVSSLLVEVMSRYVSIFVVPMVVFGACVMPKLVKNSIRGKE